MAIRKTISIQDEDEDLLDWVEEKANDGMFSSESQVVVVALKRMREDDKEVKEFLS